MAPLNPPQNFKFYCFFLQKESTFTFDVVSFSQETPNPPFPYDSPFKVDLWIFVEENK
jgi:hypothetical protein